MTIKEAFDAAWEPAVPDAGGRPDPTEIILETAGEMDFYDFRDVLACVRAALATPPQPAPRAFEDAADKALTYAHIASGGDAPLHEAIVALRNAKAPELTAAAPSAPADEAAERKAFEAHHQGHDLSRLPVESLYPGQYRSSTVQSYWQVWIDRAQLSRKSPLTEAEMHSAYCKGKASDDKPFDCFIAGVEFAQQHFGITSEKEHMHDRQAT